MARGAEETGADRLEHRSFRLPASLLERLREVAERRQTSQTALVALLLEEGLMRERHSLITFDDGPLGRRPLLAGTRLDVVQVLDTVRAERSVEKAARYLSVGTAHVQACVRFAAEYPDVVERYRRAVVEENERLRLLWEREQALLAG
jgi:uncharacterized protein (DUF433 family)